MLPAHIKNTTHLCEVIEEVIAEVGEQNVVQVVTDIATSYVATGKLLTFQVLKINLFEFLTFSNSKFPKF